MAFSLISMDIIRVLIADDHEMIRNGVRIVVESMPGWAVCGEVSTGTDAVRMAESLHPQIVVMDMAMPLLNGLEATRQIRKSLPGTEVMILTGNESEELVQQVYESGARSLILKTDGRKHVEEALQALAVHRSYFTTRAGEILFDRLLKGNKGGASQPDEGRLTAREREIVQLVTEGKINREVAAFLGISTKTVETHRAAVMRKLKLDSFSDLVRFAIRNHITSA